jgi:hypothetical protein
MLDRLDRCVEYVKEKGNREYTDFHARRIVEIACDAYIGYLLLDQARTKDEKRFTAKNFIARGEARSVANTRLVTSGDQTVLRKHKAMLEL